MKEITLYEANDTTRFESKTQCIEYEKLIADLAKCLNDEKKFLSRLAKYVKVWHPRISRKHDECNILDAIKELLDPKLTDIKKRKNMWSWLTNAIMQLPRFGGIEGCDMRNMVNTVEDIVTEKMVSEEEAL